MASRVTSQIKEELLVCQICFEEYDRPKALPCQHTFCQRCLVKTAGATSMLTCPNCRRQCQLPDNGVEGLPSSIFVNQLRDIIEDGSPAGHHDRPSAKSPSRPCHHDPTYPHSNGGTAANPGHNLVSVDIRKAARYTPLAPAGGHSGRNTDSRQTRYRVLPSSGRYDAIDDFFARLCSSRFIHPDRVLPILSWLKEQDITTAQDLHDNWDNVQNRVDMTNAMKQHITEALERFSQAEP